MIQLSLNKNLIGFYLIASNLDLHNEFFTQQLLATKNKNKQEIWDKINLLQKETLNSLLCKINLYIFLN